MIGCIIFCFITKDGAELGRVGGRGSLYDSSVSYSSPRNVAIPTEECVQVMYSKGGPSKNDLKYNIPLEPETLMHVQRFSPPTPFKNRGRKPISDNGKY